MSFGCSELWDRLGGQASVMIGQWHSRQPLTNHKYRLFTQSIPELTALKACTHSHYSFWDEKWRLPCTLMSPINILQARAPFPLSSPRLHAHGNYNRRQNCRDIVLKQGNFREQKNPHPSPSPPFKVRVLVVFYRQLEQWHNIEWRGWGRKNVIFPFGSQ